MFFVSMYLKNFLIGRKLLYNVVSVSAIQEHKSIVLYTHTHTHTHTYVYMSPPS